MLLGSRNDSCDMHLGLTVTPLIYRCKHNLVPVREPEGQIYDAENPMLIGEHVCIRKLSD